MVLPLVHEVRRLRPRRRCRCCSPSLRERGGGGLGGAGCRPGRTRSRWTRSRSRRGWPACRPSARRPRRVASRQAKVNSKIIPNGLLLHVASDHCCPCPGSGVAAKIRRDSPRPKGGRRTSRRISPRPHSCPNHRRGHRSPPRQQRANLRRAAPSPHFHSLGAYHCRTRQEDTGSSSDRELLQRRLRPIRRLSRTSKQDPGISGKLHSFYLHSISRFAYQSFSRRIPVASLLNTYGEQRILRGRCSFAIRSKISRNSRSSSPEKFAKGNPPIISLHPDCEIGINPRLPVRMVQHFGG